MGNSKRIISVIIVLIGGTLVFAFWAYHNFDDALSSITKLNNPVSKVATTSSMEISTTTQELISTSTEIQIGVQNGQIATTSIKDMPFKFIFPGNYTSVYQGCTYPVSWSTSQNINSIDLALVDAGTREHIGQIAGGVPKNITGKKIQSFNWKVGSVWPGKYYILSSNINGATTTVKSVSFEIMEVPDGANIEEICKN